MKLVLAEVGHDILALAPVDINSIPQQAVAKGSGHNELRRDQFTPFRRRSVTKSSLERRNSSLLAWNGVGVGCILMALLRPLVH